MASGCCISVIGCKLNCTGIEQCAMIVIQKCSAFALLASQVIVNDLYRAVSPKSLFLMKDEKKSFSLVFILL